MTGVVLTAATRARATGDGTGAVPTICERGLRRAEVRRPPLPVRLVATIFVHRHDKGVVLNKGEILVKYAPHQETYPLFLICRGLESTRSVV